MNILTKDGYKNIEDVEIGEELVYYDLITGQKSTNQLVAKTLLNANGYREFEHFDLYRVNGMTLSGFDSIWVLENGNWNVNHVQNLMTGSIICDDLDNDLIINSYEWIGTSSTFWQLSVSGDSSYIGDGLTLHNASRFWVGGGSTNDWTATGNTNWSSTSGGANNSSVPVAADIAFFDSNSSAFPCTVTTLVSITSMSFTGHTGTLTINGTISLPGTGGITFSGLSTIGGSGTIQIGALNQISTIVTNSQTINCNFYSYGTRVFNGTFSVGGMITNDNGNPSVPANFDRTNIGDNLYANGGFTLTNGLMRGSMPIWFCGGTVTTTRLNSTDSGFQSGHYYFSGNPTVLTFSCAYGTYSYVTGSPNMTNSVLHNNGLTVNLNLAGMVWNRVNLVGETVIIILLSDLESNSAILNGGGTFILRAGTTMSYLKTGSLDFQRGALTGSASIAFVRPGTWTFSTSGTEIRLPISYEPGCDITLSKNNFVFTGASMTYNGGTVTTTGATMTIYTTTRLDLKGGFGFDNLAFNNANFFTITNLSEILVTGTLSVQSGVITCNGGTINPRNINMTTDLRGTTDITIKQTGDLKWTAGASSVIRNNIIFDSPGTSNITGNIRHITGTISYVKGRFTGNSTFTYLGTSQIITNFSQSLPTSMFGNFN